MIKGSVALIVSIGSLMSLSFQPSKPFQDLVGPRLFEARIEDSLAGCIDKPGRGIDSRPGTLHCGTTVIEYDKLLMAGDQCKHRAALTLASDSPGLVFTLCSEDRTPEDVLYATIPDRRINYYVRSPKARDVLMLIAVAKADAGRRPTK
jgi:hypothetical protein